ncbi:MAG: MoaD/ThiS family protein [Bacteriovoracaceae bacterium]|jgi:molybdopterin converting factor subunit 1|nr:MoaD/ThiS family protein [Bacteriovoracaceae bacterium]
MKIKVKYFAMLRASAGKSEEELETTASTPSELFGELKERYNFKIDHHHLKVAINESYAPFDQSLCESDTVVFIPPVAGG